MSKILKRPMFRKGGPTNDGIMSMVVPKRAMYQNPPADGASIEDNFVLDPNDPILQKSRKRASILKQAAGTGRSERDRLLDLLFEGSIALGAGTGAGEKLPTAIFKSFQDPAKKYTEGKQKEEDFNRQINLLSATGAISSSEAEEIAKRKAESDFRIASIRGAGPTIEEKIFSVATKNLDFYAQDFNKAKNKATFDLIKRNEIADKFGETQVGGTIDLDYTDPNKVKQWIKSNKNKIGKIFYDLNSGNVKQLQQDADGNFGFGEVDLKTTGKVQTTAPVTTLKKNDPDAAAKAYRKMIDDALEKKRYPEGRPQSNITSDAP